MSAGKKDVQEKMSNAVEHAREAAQNVTSALSDFFQGNPFETEVGKKIEMAADAEHLTVDNWGLNMEIVDYVNYTEEGGRNAIRAIRKRLQTHMGKNTGVIMYTLTVLETLVKNCDQRFKALVCQKEFVNELVRLISAKFDAPQSVQERVLSLIQSWADAFRGNPALSGVCEIYDELKAKGVEFPATDFDSMAPIITPKRTVFNETAAAQSIQPPGSDLPQSSSTNPTNAPASVPLPAASAAQPTDPMTKLRADVDVVTVNLTVLRDLLTELKPGEELPEEMALIQDLHASLKEMQQRIVALISSEFNEDVTYELITVNQEINNAFEKYDRFVSKRNGKPAETPETEDNRQLREQLESFGVYDKEKPGGSKQASAEPELQLDSLRTVALEKPMLTDEQAKEVEEWLGEGTSTSKDTNVETKKPDDGL
ncbi:Target of Myb protein 1 [Aphelenchoides fujianensis]|nr:Target of Myb protein 1 [Aphelenchoides fujianensis]